MTATEVNRGPGPAADRFGREVGARLSASLEDLPYEVTERLRAARMQAVAARKRVQPLRAPRLVPAGAGTFDEERLSLWQRAAAVLPLVVLVAGLVLIHGQQNEFRAFELAEVDVALLTDDLPPAAYADPGFLQFLKTHRE